MFGSLVMKKTVQQVLEATVGVTTAVGATNIWSTPIPPQDAPFPVCLHYYDGGTYQDGPIDTEGQDVNGENIRCYVKLMDLGASTVTIEDPAEAQLNAFAGKSFNVEYKGRNYKLSFRASGELPLGSMVDSGVWVVQMGTVYDVEITRAE